MVLLNYSMVFTEMYNLWSQLYNNERKIELLFVTFISTVIDE